MGFLIFLHPQESSRWYFACSFNYKFQKKIKIRFAFLTVYDVAVWREFLYLTSYWHAVSLTKVVVCDEN